MLVVEQVHHTRCPLTHHHQVRRGLIEPQKTQGSRLFHTIHGISKTYIYITSKRRFIFTPSPTGFGGEKKCDKVLLLLLLTTLLLVFKTHPATKIRGISPAKASAISRLPTFAIQWSARHMKVGLRLERSFLMALLIRRISSLLLFTKTEMNR